MQQSNVHKWPPKYCNDIKNIKLKPNGKKLVNVDFRPSIGSVEPSDSRKYVCVHRLNGKRLCNGKILLKVSSGNGVTPYNGLYREAPPARSSTRHGIYPSRDPPVRGSTP